MPIDTNATGLSWYAATAVASPPRPRLTIEVDVDVCVVGGGLAGLTAALEVARRGWSVLLLEARRIAWNASGRNSGMVLPGFAADAGALVERVGLVRARALWALSQAGAEYVRARARDMPGADLTEGGWLHVSTTDRMDAMAKRADHLADLGAMVEMWPAERIRQELRSSRYFDALHYPDGFSIHPLNYALGLAAEAEATGVRIYEESPALEIDPVGVRKRIVTQDGRVRAAHVVLAGNVHLGRLAPEYAAMLLPIHSSIIVTEPLGRALRELIHTPGGVSDTEMAENHYRVVDGDRLLWSGHGTVWPGPPRNAAAALLREIGRTYPSLRGVKVEHIAVGTSGIAVHRMPQVGEISPGLWLLSGFGGHGINTTAMGGELLARAIVEGDTSWRVFEPFALVWAGGTLGRIAQQAATWVSRARERIESTLARRRNGLHDGMPDDTTSGVVDTPQFAERAASSSQPELPPPAPEVAEPPPAIAEAIEVTPLASEPSPPEVEAPPLQSESLVTETAPPSGEKPPPKPKRKRGKRRKTGPNAPPPASEPPGGDQT
jgi:gamma-glutamylputrescine oxidase